jgi:hypothetical protein
MARTITLTESELRFAAYGGVDRQVNALAHQRSDQFKPRDYWGTHILACMAELAVAKWRGRYWSPAYDRENLPGSSDLGERGEVRSSTNLDSPLILRPRDREKGESPFVLVVTEPPDMHLVGWAYGRDVMVDEFWVEREPAYWAMPQDRLQPINPTKGATQ